MQAMTQSGNTRLGIEDGIATVTLNQPEKHNAFDDRVIQELLTHFDAIRENGQVRVMILQAEGKHFCAGADLAWMKRMATMDHQENLADAGRLATLMETLNTLPVPCIARVQGAAYGGALGLIACCDIAVAESRARFCLSEVRLGLAPATIGPYVYAAIGERQCRRLFLTGEVFAAEEAKRIGLIHEVVDASQLDEIVNDLAGKVRETGPEASRACKQLVRTISARPENLSEYTSDLIASLRVSAEGQEGLGAFFEKRTPAWRQQGDEA